jgi:polyisoprenoid-binding protein YceI
VTQRVFCAAAAALVALTGSLAAGEPFKLNGQNTTITFIGTKPNGKHDGGFKQLTGTASVDGADLTTLKVSVEIDMNSLYSDNGKLTNHLKSPDFFGVKSNPASKFVSTKVEKSADGYRITGDLTMCGQTRPVTFPAAISVNGGTLTVTSGKFTIDRTQWGMTYGREKIHDDVTLSVSLKATK